MKFIFPVYHKHCESCKNRFQCMTNRINVDISTQTARQIRRRFHSVFIPFNISSNCFETGYCGDIRIINSKTGSTVVFE